jgi:hypothetical protein
MSLINEALKRAEEEKLGRNERSGITLAPIPQEKEKSVLSPFVILSLFIFFLGVGMMTLTLLLPGGSLFSPDQAEAVALLTEANSSAPTTEQEAVIKQTMESLKYYDPQKARRKAESLESAAMADATETSLSDAAGQPAESQQESRVNRQSSLHPSAFKVSAIIHGQDGATAIINGKFLKVGSVLDGATVTEITQYSVVLERNARKITIQM